MTIKCKAAVIRKNDCEKPYANSKPLSIEEISIDNPRDNEVLVKVKGLIFAYGFSESFFLITAALHLIVIITSLFN